ncbi:MAG: 7,8-didemethyl-8-hydroxy-5-deazariboflavin synthase CofG [Candidatus Binatia bacterium]
MAPEYLRRARAAVRGPLDRALAGARIGVADARVLMAAEAPGDIAAILAVAGHIRTRLKGTVVTYSPKVFLPVTNLCRDRCAYCTFRSDPGDAHAWTMRPQEVRDCCRRGRAQGCIEALMCLGDKPEVAFRRYRTVLHTLGHTTTIGYVRQTCEIALQEGLLPHTNAGVMTREEMADLKPVNVSMGLMLENISPRLRRRGEAHFHAPDKDPQVRLRMLREAGELRIPFTTGILLGIGETREERIASLVAIGDLHADHGHIQEVIIQNFRAKPTTKMAGAPEPENVDIAQTIAVARLLLGDMNIQAPPNLSPYDHRLFLAAGINDWGGISPLTPDFVNPEAPWPHLSALADTCATEGFRLEARLPIYPEYIDRSGFLDPSMRAALAPHAANREGALC